NRPDRRRRDRSAPAERPGRERARERRRHGPRDATPGSIRGGHRGVDSTWPAERPQPQPGPDLDPGGVERRWADPRGAARPPRELGENATPGAARFAERAAPVGHEDRSADARRERRQQRLVERARQQQYGGRATGPEPRRAGGDQERCAPPGDETRGRP